MSDTIKLELDGAVAIVSLNRPDRHNGGYPWKGRQVRARHPPT